MDKGVTLVPSCGFIIQECGHLVSSVVLMVGSGITGNPRTHLNKGVIPVPPSCTMSHNYCGF